MLGAYNRTTALKAAVLSGWITLDAALQERAQAVSALLRVTAEPPYSPNFPQPPNFPECHLIRQVEIVLVL